MAFGYDGSIRIDTKINSKSFRSGVDSMGNYFKNGINKMMASLGKLAAAAGIALAVDAVVDFGKEAVKAASNLSSALSGLESILDGQGRSFANAKLFIQDYIKDGLIPMENAVTAYKNLASRGYSTEQIEKTLVALKDAAAFGRQASYSMGEAVATATEGLRNENSILVDNAGVTKNVAKMWDEYAKSIGTTAAKLTQQQKIQAEVNGILEESKYQVGDAAKLSTTYAGQVAELTFQFQQFKVALGDAIIPVAKAVIPGIKSITAALTELAQVFAQVTTLLFGGDLSSPADDALKDQAESEDEVTKASKDASKATDDASDATEDMGKASKKAAKEMEGVTAGFDDINKLATRTADTVEDAADGLDDGLNIDKIGEGELFGGLKISPEVLDFVERLKSAVQALADILRRIWDVFAAAWASKGAKVIEAAKAALQSIWELIKAIGNAFLEAWTGGAGEKLLETILTILANVLSFISQLADQMRQVWDEMGQQLVEAFLFAITSILELINSIGVAFAEAWNSGVGIEILRTIMAILTDVFNIVGTLANKLREAWEANNNGVEIWRSILNIVLEILEFINRLTTATLNWAQELNFEPAITALKDLLKVLEPLVQIILDGLAWAYENVLLPLGKWTIEEAAPQLIKMLSAAFEALRSIIKAMAPITEGLMKNFLIPLAEWSGERFLNNITLITDKLKEFSDWAQQNPQAIQAIGTVIEAFLGIFVVTKALSSIPRLIFMFGQFVDVLEGTNLAALGVKFSFGLLLAGVLAFISVADKMSGIEKVAAILLAIAAAATTAAIAVGIFQVTATMGLVAAGIAAGIALITVSIMAASRAAQSASKYSGAGRRSYSTLSNNSGGRMYAAPNIPVMENYSIPKLANGAVIPPNQEFLAMLGDQRGGTNIETPVPTMENTFRKVLAESNFGGGDITITMPVYLNGREIFRDQQVISRQIGKNLVAVGSK